ncbi:class I SAM-dependent methyltransferase [Flavobacterium sp.]|uniref:class I SAM-dependent methyltransferase n=1 Tax=Flavobacterium sp. TaxID=239 RepID=UPI003C3B9BB8
MKDLFGQAIFDFQTNNQPQDLITSTSISEEDEMSVAYLFRTYEEMPKIEQKALQLAKGKVLDIGCGAGSHSLYLQNERGLDVTAIDISEKAIETCQLRGIKKASVKDFMLLEKQKYDTILLMMNGTGICGKLNKLPVFLNKLKSLLAPGGQILIDSSDIIYMFDEDEEGAYEVLANGYYGELVFEVSYKGQKEQPLDWLYLDYNTLQNAAYANRLQAELILEGEHYDYLARLTIA